MRYFSTFTGVGGFEIGIHNAWVRYTNPQLQRRIRTTGDTFGQPEQHDKHGDEGLSCIGYSEIDKYATAVYEQQFKGVKNYGDITKIDADSLPDFDCLVGGFPCQAFSIAGRRAGFEDTRGTLFFDLARILRAKQPRLFVFENVKGLQSHDDGRTFRTIVAAITELGYDLQWQVVNSKDFGVPQNRERIILVGHLRGTPRPQVFPIGTNSHSDIVLPTLTARYYGAQANGGYIGDQPTKVGTYRTHRDGQGFRESKSGLVPTIPARGREDGSGQAVILQRPRGKNAGGEHAIAPTVSAKSYTDNNHLQDGLSLRRLTPIECERLQGFPDNWTQYGCTTRELAEGEKFSAVLHHSLPFEISDSQRYKMCGNAVTTNVIQAVFERIFYGTN